VAKQKYASPHVFPPLHIPLYQDNNLRLNLGYYLVVAKLSISIGYSQLKHFTLSYYSLNHVHLHCL